MERDDRLRAARISLEGLSVGDAVGRNPALTGSGWRYSDDTEMAIAIVDVLKEHGTIEQDALAAAFAQRFERDPERGYGPVAYWQLHQLVQGRDWRGVSTEVFKGKGSFGNGAAMRVGPLGAWFSSDVSEAARQARLSAAVTHAHPDGQAGAIAVAVAAAHLCSAATSGEVPTARAMFDVVLHHTPDGSTRSAIVTAADIQDADPVEAAEKLGDGAKVISADTVPIALWCAFMHMDSFENALRAALTACQRPTADRDTVCAIVGSLVVLTTGLESIPPPWLEAREPLPH